ncbi:MAG TPA: thioredoxin family protein, partial [Paenirhodobacter sp.]
TRLSATGTNRIEQALIDRLRAGQEAPVAMNANPGGAMMQGGAMTPNTTAQTAMTSNAMAPTNAMTSNAMMGTADPDAMMMAAGTPPAPDLPVEAIRASLEGATDWLNSAPLTLEQLRGKVVLIDFWTYSCINCLRAIPYVEAWAEKYRDQGLVVIGVHAPEFAFEKRIDNVRGAVADLGIAYPVAIDNDYRIWRTFNNQYWPAHYFIDAQGRVRHHQFGEGNYDHSEQVIQQLLAEAGQSNVPTGTVAVAASGAAAASDQADVQSPETYVGYLRAQNFIGADGLVADTAHDYAAASPRRNEWGLTGTWTAGAENATLDAADGSLYFRFRARDLHLVLGPGADGKPVRFRVTIDGQAPGADHGTDIDAMGDGVVTEERLYQLIRQQGPVADHTFEIRFMDMGARAYAFTFG